MANLKIIVEDRIPFIKGVFEQVGAHVDYLPSAAINREVMADADALVTRTRTRCDEALLGGSRCSIVATATIGTDHIDIGWCRNAGIEVANAPGCNAPAVAQWVMRAILQQYPDPRGLTLAVVGVGHVGSIVCRWAEALGMNTLPIDPPLQRSGSADGKYRFTTLQHAAARADVITLHTPMTKTGPDATYHLLGEEFFDSLRRTPMLLNAARGPVVDTEALLLSLSSGKVSQVAIDCWEGEPRISLPLLDKAVVATPHIAGYSRQGKIRATYMAVDAVCRHFNLPMPHLSEPRPADAPETVTVDGIVDTYDILADTAALKNDPEAFEHLRNTYALRNEP